MERTEFEKEVLEKNEKIADLKERLQVKVTLFSRARSIFSRALSSLSDLCSLLSTLYSLLPNLYTLLSRSIYLCHKFLWYTLGIVLSLTCNFLSTGEEVRDSD